MNIKKKQKLPNQIKKIRELREINRKSLAGKLGYQNSTSISNWDNGQKELSLRSTLKLQLTLGVRIDQLFPHLVWEIERELLENNSQALYESKTNQSRNS
ncbi:helix-turn-helix transcriptional regulator [bacterium]|nr:helix-turn-helix transcriptional regulator [bacterium]